MTIVVTGASGFIGRALLAVLAERKIPLLAVTRGDTRCLSVPAVQVPDYLATPCPLGATLVHLAEDANIAAANARGQSHVDDVRRTVDELCRKGFRRIVYASSGQVYRTAGSDSPYIAGKRAAEAIVRAAGGAALRLANVYGPGMPQKTLMADILRQIPGTGPLRLLSAAPRRDFLWVGDAADGFAAVALGTASGTYDLGSGVTLSAGEVARLALDAAGEGNRAITAEREGSDDDVVRLAIAPLKADFGWEPRTSLRDGLGQIVRAAAA